MQGALRNAEPQHKGRKNIRLGELLVDSGMINEQQLTSALEVQRQSGANGWAIF
jgi:hypothetical protein